MTARMECQLASGKSTISEKPRTSLLTPALPLILPAPPQGRWQQVSSSFEYPVRFL